MCEQSRIVGNEHNRLGSRECNCNEQKWDNVYDDSTDRGVSDMTIIATNYR